MHAPTGILWPLAAVAVCLAGCGQAVSDATGDAGPTGQAGAGATGDGGPTGHAGAGADTGQPGVDAGPLPRAFPTLDLAPGLTCDQTSGLEIVPLTYQDFESGRSPDAGPYPAIELTPDPGTCCGAHSINVGFDPAVDPVDRGTLPLHWAALLGMPSQDGTLFDGVGLLVRNAQPVPTECALLVEGAGISGDASPDCMGAGWAGGFAFVPGSDWAWYAMAWDELAYGGQVECHALTSIYDVRILAPTDRPVDLWIDSIAFYRSR